MNKSEQYPRVLWDVLKENSGKDLETSGEDGQREWREIFEGPGRLEPPEVD